MFNEGFSLFNSNRNSFVKDFVKRVNCVYDSTPLLQVKLLCIEEAFAPLTVHDVHLYSVWPDEN